MRADKRNPDSGLRLLTLSLIILTGMVACTSTPPADNTEEEPAEPTVQKYAFDTDYLRGYFDPANHPDFVEIDTLHADRPGLFLRQDVYEAFLKMYRAAQEQDINLVIRSATRNFDYQKRNMGTQVDGTDQDRRWVRMRRSPGQILWKERKTILKYSSMPGTSRHHWGTDIDLNAFENSWFESGEGLEVYTFLQVNASSFGFCQPYTPKGESRPFGYEEEKWHWTYMPVSEELTRLAADSLKNTMIEGFKGAEAAADIDVVTMYVLGISEACK